MRYVRFTIIFAAFLTGFLSGRADSICETPLRYEVLHTNDPTDGFFWVAGDRRYNAYSSGADFIIERKKGNGLWLVRGAAYSPYPGSEMYIDTLYFKNVSESKQKELIVRYSLFSLHPQGSHTSRHLMVIDLSEKTLVLNIALYDDKIDKDENGKVGEYYYEAQVELSHNIMRVTSTDESDIDNSTIQLDDGLYFRKGHCYIGE